MIHITTIQPKAKPNDGVMKTVKDSPAVEKGGSDNIPDTHENKPSDDNPRKRKLDDIDQDPDDQNAIAIDTQKDIKATENEAKKIRLETHPEIRDDIIKSATAGVSGDKVSESIDGASSESKGTVDTKVQDEGTKVSGNVVDKRKVGSAGEGFTEGKEEDQVDDRSELKTRSLRKRKRSGGEAQAASMVPPPTSTYDKVRLIIQPWRKPEGGVNKPVLKMMLESVMLFLMMKPGSTETVLLKRYLPYLQPMVLRNIVKILEEIGCVKKRYFKKSRCSLFSKPAMPEISETGTEDHEAMFIPTEECLFRLGQFGREFYPNAVWPQSTV